MPTCISIQSFSDMPSTLDSSVFPFMRFRGPTERLRDKLRFGDMAAVKKVAIDYHTRYRNAADCHMETGY